MSNYAYVAVNPAGVETRGILDVPDQGEALKRIKEMGLFATRVSPATKLKVRKGQAAANRETSFARILRLIGGRVRPRVLTVFTRQLATLVEAGMPLLRGLRLLEEQEESQALKRVIREVALAVESGSSFSEALAGHPKVFNRLYLNMVEAGEISGALEITLRRLAEFTEKAQKIKGKVKAALVYPCAVLTIAAGIVAVMMVYVVPKFKAVFDGLMNGMAMPAFTRFIFGLSESIKDHFVTFAAGAVLVAFLFWLSVQTKKGRWIFDLVKLRMPVLGPVFRKAAVSKLTRTLGTLVGNGVPILQALTIAKETTGNVVIGRVISNVHESVKQGDPIAPTLKCSNVFPGIAAGMVDVGEQTGALPEMLLKIADNYDEEVDNATSAMTALLEPFLIVILAVVVGSIVIAIFLPLVIICNFGGPDTAGERG